MRIRYRFLIVLAFLFLIFISVKCFAATYTITVTDTQDAIIQKYVNWQNNIAKAKDPKYVSVLPADFLQNYVSGSISQWNANYMNYIKEAGFANFQNLSQADQAVVLGKLGLNP